MGKKRITWDSHISGALETKWDSLKFYVSEKNKAKIMTSMEHWFGIVNPCHADPGYTLPLQTM